MVHLLNGNPQERVRASENFTLLPCGCGHSDVLWLQMCDAHHTEFQRLHLESNLTHMEHSA